MYCVNCGVRLADTEEKCPLCGTRVYHPDIQRPEVKSLFPKNAYPEVRPRQLWPQVILTALFLLPMNIVLVCDTRITGEVTWSGFVVGALAIAYVMLVLPLWFVKPNPVVFVPCSFAAIILFLHYINYAVEGNWFWTFAFPIAGFIGLLVTAQVVLFRYVKKGGLYILGGGFIALGGFMLLMEHLMYVTFPMVKFLGWSLYPLVSLVLFGGLLIFLAICRPAREKMERKLFI